MADDTDTDRKEMIAQFCDVTGVPNDRATFYLESANWTLQVRFFFFLYNSLKLHCNCAFFF